MRSCVHCIVGIVKQVRVLGTLLPLLLEEMALFRKPHLGRTEDMESCSQTKKAPVINLWPPGLGTRTFYG